MTKKKKQQHATGTPRGGRKPTGGDPAPEHGRHPSRRKTDAVLRGPRGEDRVLHGTVSPSTARNTTGARSPRSPRSTDSIKAASSTDASQGTTARQLRASGSSGFRGWASGLVFTPPEDLPDVSRAANPARAVIERVRTYWAIAGSASPYHADFDRERAQSVNERLSLAGAGCDVRTLTKVSLPATVVDGVAIFLKRTHWRLTRPGRSAPSWEDMEELLTRLETAALAYPEGESQATTVDGRSSGSTGGAAELPVSPDELDGTDIATLKVLISQAHLVKPMSRADIVAAIANRYPSWTTTPYHLRDITFHKLGPLLFPRVKGRSRGQRLRPEMVEIARRIVAAWRPTA